MYSVQLVYDLPHRGIDLLVALYLFGRINEKNVDTSFKSQLMFLFTPALTDSSFEKIALHRPFKEFLGHGNHYAVDAKTIISQTYIPEPRNIPVLTLGKKQSNAGLAAQSFFLRKSIRCRNVHLYFFDRYISRAFATEGASTVGAEISIERPASSIALTMDLPYETNLMSP